MGMTGGIHWIIILIIILVLFGAGRVSNVMGELGKGLKSFKQGMADDEDDKYRRYEDQRRADPPRLPREQEPIDVAARREEQTPRPTRDDEAR